MKYEDKKSSNSVILNKENQFNIEKKEFFRIYEKVKKQEIDILTLDQEMIKRILIMIKEELNINNEKINQKFNTLKTLKKKLN